MNWPPHNNGPSPARANAQLGGQRLVDAIQFIKALGGGWRDQQLFADAKANAETQASSRKSE